MDGFETIKSIVLNDVLFPNGVRSERNQQQNLEEFDELEQDPKGWICKILGFFGCSEIFKRKTKKKKWDEEHSKKVLKTNVICHPVTKRKNSSNYIRTTKYTLLTFLPVALFIQLFKFSNLYFLSVMFFNLLPGVSVIFPVTSILPNIYIFGSALLREGVEDIGRLRADLKANGKIIEIYDRKEKAFLQKKTSQINSGDIVRIRVDQEIPCDLLILYAPKKESCCHITTANLDGETNLKKRQGIYKYKGFNLPEGEIPRHQANTEKHPKWLTTSKEERRFLTKIIHRNYSVELEENTENLDQMKGKLEREERELVRTRTDLQIEKEEIEMTEFHAGSLEQRKWEEIEKELDERDDIDTPVTTEPPVIIQFITERWKQKERSTKKKEEEEEEEENEEGGEEISTEEEEGSSSSTSSNIDHNEEIIKITEEEEEEEDDDDYVDESKKDNDNDDNSPKEQELSTFHERNFGINSILLRGVYLRITPYVVGLATYTGKKTKLYRNLKKSRTKWGIMDIKMNYRILSLLLAQQVLVFLGIGLAYYFRASIAQESWYLNIIDSVSEYTWYQPIQNWMTFLIVIELFIPMSLFVTMQLVLMVQAFLMEFAIVHYEDPPDDDYNFGTTTNKKKSSQKDRRIKKKMTARTSNLGFDLAHIDIVFSDKTGTLTENKMEYSKVFILDEIFTKDMNISDSIRQIEMDERTTKIDRDDDDDDDDEEEEEEKEEEEFLKKKKKKYLDLFLLNLILNNTVTPHKTKKSVKYDGPSPDEVALVSQCGRGSEYVMLERLSDRIICLVRGERVVWKILDLIPFNSKRKRMSVVVQQMTKEEEEELLEDGGGDPTTVSITDEYPIYFLCKGADSELLKRSNDDEETKNIMSKAVDDFSCSGLRTLVLGYKSLTCSKFLEFHNRYTHAKSQVSNQARAMEDVAGPMEMGLSLLGTTAIEDELQQGVPEAVDYLRRAGLQVWILTGDKTETAVSVGYQSSVMKRGKHTEVYLTKKSYKGEINALKNMMITFLRYFEDPVKFMKSKLKEEEDDKDEEKEEKNEKEEEEEDDDEEEEEKFNLLKKQKYVIMVDNGSLDDIMNSKSLKRMFVKLATYASSVLCCRVTPIQKAIVTKTIQKQLKKRGVAIGDGANDVSMIQKAYVGIGIMGNEGSQAARASDFALPKFKYIVDLLAVQGRYCYLRSSDCVLVSLYKNLLYSITNYLFLFFSLFSGQLMFDSWIYQTYNTLYHLFPPFLQGWLEKDLPEDVIKRCPSLYPSLRKKDPYFNRKRLLYWYGVSVYQSLVCFFGVYFIATKTNLLGGFESTEDIFTFGHVVMSSMMITMFFTYAINTRSWTYLHMPAFTYSFLVFVLWSTIDSSYTSFLGINDFYYIAIKVYDKIQFYFIIVFVVSVALLPIFIQKYVWLKFFPSNAQKVLSLGRKNILAMTDEEIKRILIPANERNEKRKESRRSWRKESRKNGDNIV